MQKDVPALPNVKVPAHGDPGSSVSFKQFHGSVLIRRQQVADKFSPHLIGEAKTAVTATHFAHQSIYKYTAVAGL